MVVKERERERERKGQKEWEVTFKIPYSDDNEDVNNTTRIIINETRGIMTSYSYYPMHNGVHTRSSRHLVRNSTS